MKRNGRDRRDEFLEEFNHCYDGVVRRVRVQFQPSEPSTNLNVTLSVRRPSTQQVNDGWVNVRLAIEQVEEFALRDSPTESCRVLSSGLQIGLFDHLYFFDF